jgi:adenylate cyclase
MIFGASCAVLPPLPAWNLQFHDLALRLAASGHHSAQPPRMTLLALDEDSLAALPGPLALMHEPLALLFETLADSGARGVAVDLILPARDYESLVPGSDARLMRGILALRAKAPLVLGRTVDAGGTELPIHRPFLAAAGPEGTALVLLPLDADGVVRRFDEGLGTGGSTLPTLAGTLARRLGMTPGRGLVDFSQPVTFDVVTVRQALQWALADDETGRQRLRAAFDGRVVFLGAVLPFEDRLRTPLQTGADTVPGVQVHMQVLQAMEQGQWLREWPAAATAAACALLALLGWQARNGRQLALAGIGSTAGVATAHAAGLALGMSLPSASLALAAGLPALARWGGERGRELIERRRLRAAFAGYVSPAVMAELESGRLSGLASARREVAVLFLDIRGFTTRSQTSPPEDVVSTLNLIFEVATETIHAHGGTVKEFMGDGVLAFFGAPQALPHPAQAAFDAARAIVASLPAVNGRLAQRGWEPLRIGMGLSFGQAVVGHVGAASRHAYGAVGDCVNVASRLEGLTKERGYTLLISDDARRGLIDADGVEALGSAALKGHSAIEIHGWQAPAAAAATGQPPAAA